MNPDNPELPPRHRAMRLDRAARFEHGQIERMCVVGFDPRPHQNCVTMPAETAGADIKRHRMPGRFCFDQSGWQTALARSESPVSFLQRDDIGVDLVEDFQDTFRIALLIKPDAFMDIIGRDLQRQCHSIPASINSALASSWSSSKTINRTGIANAALSAIFIPPSKVIAPIPCDSKNVRAISAAIDDGYRASSTKAMGYWAGPKYRSVGRVGIPSMLMFRPFALASHASDSI